MKYISDYPDRGFHLALRRLTTTTVVIVIAITLLNLLGWIFHIAALKSILPNLATMKPLTALCLLLAAIALWLQRPTEGEGVNKTHIHWSHLCAGLSMLIGTMMLLEYATGATLGIDLWLFRKSVLAEGGLYPGRSSAITAFCFLLLGLSLWTLNAKSNWFAAVTALLVLIISSIALIGYILGSTALYEVGPFSSVALHTAFSFALLSLGTLAVQSELPVTAVLSTRLTGSMMARRLLLPAVLLPILLTWLYLINLQFGLFNLEFGLTILAVSNIVIIVALIYATAHFMNKGDAERRLTADAIQKSELQLTSVIKSAMDAIIIIDHNYTIINFNHAAERIFGHSADDLIGQSIKRLLPPRHHTSCYQFIQQLAQMSVTTNNTEAIQPLYGLRANGKEIPVEASISPVQVDEEKFFIIILRDITQRLTDETWARFQVQLLAQMNDAVIAADTQLKITSWNHAAEKIYGWQADEAIGQSIIQLLLTEYIDETPESVMERFQTNGHWQGEVWQTHKDGHKIPVQTSVAFMQDEEEHPLGVVSVNRSLKKVKHIEERYQSLFTYAPVMYVVTEIRLGRAYVANCNDSFIKMLGYTYKEVVGRPLADFYSLASRLALEDGGGYQRALEGEFNAEERQLLAKDGRILDTLLRAYPEKDMNGEVIGTLAIFVDISQRKEVETRLRELNEQLQALNKVRSRLVDDISHEWRTPLSNINLYTTLLVKKPERYEKYTAILQEQAERMNHLMEVIVAYAKLPTTIEDLDRVDVDLNSSVASVIQEHLSTAESKGIELSHHFAADLPLLHCVPDLLERCLSYLLHNAIAYTIAGTVTITTFANDGNLYIRFADTGMGIAKKELALIFDRFYRGEAVGSLSIPGVGVGLSIAKEIASLHNGEILVESEVGVGSTFTLCLPLKGGAYASHLL